ncbi:MAG TPA: hypothetical protein VFZ11_02325 [Gemmatimonadaceae bacterium]
MTRALLIATILMVASGCDKARELAGGGTRAQAAEPSAPRTNLAARPDVLYQVFGEREDPRMIPLAIVENGALRRINLDAEGWRRFDALYQKSGTSYPIYRDGQPAGTLTIRQGMWERPSAPVYSLPNCELLTPLSAVSLKATGRLGYTVEFLASTARIRALATGSRLDRGRVEQLGRDVGRQVAGKAGIDPSELDSLDFSAVAVTTGATQEPTIVATFIDPRASERAGTDERIIGVFAIADAAADGEYRPSFTHVIDGPAVSAQTRRFVDHLDVNSDGVSEIVLESSGDPEGAHLLVLGHQGGRWKETFRSSPSWCLDERGR